MALQTDASGDATFPATYTFPTHPIRTVLGVPSVIYKASTRLWGGVISPSEINGINANNIPFLRFAVDFDAANEAPVTALTFKVTSASGNAAGDLIASSISSTGKLFFELPLTQENLPFLASGNVAPIALAFTIAAKDDALNEGTLANQGVTFSVIAPPISVRRSGAPAVVDSNATGSSLGNLPGYVGYYFAGVTSSRYDKLYQSGTQ